MSWKSLPFAEFICEKIWTEPIALFSSFPQKLMQIQDEAGLNFMLCGTMRGSVTGSAIEVLASYVSLHTLERCLCDIQTFKKTGRFC